ncbi:tRNA pseudouridine(55) synthase TruB [Pelagibacterium montanilacus]|uniref:tRNA pseudouridine(55) synthase TruB n=1 Tax=Pelagibacterium montanilacus TaxID=2185280 RepID=UPI000F8C579A|nr:tRNA pseudouridine(55) synthase TruB [Pelagibacterium montanilacus]
MSEQKKRVKRAISGWLVLDKPYDMSSTEAVGKLRWLMGAKKAGHAGTLDPLATGLLPIAFGEATKTVPFVQDGTKVYVFELVWGSQTSTDDTEGEVIETSDHRPTREDIEAALPAFRGAVTQIPPQFSALKVAGERAYDLARAGEVVDLPERTVEIDAFDLLDHTPERSRFEVTCAKGTYIRALARDLALALGTRGHVGALRRSRVGVFGEASAVDFAAFEAASPDERDAMLLPVAAGLGEVEEVRVDARQAMTIRLGNPVLLVGRDAPVELDPAWASTKGEAVAVGHVENGQFKPRRVILPSV